MKRWIYVGLGIVGMAVAFVLAQMPGIVGWVAFGTVGIASTWIVGKYPWLLGVAMMILPLPIAIAQYPLSHKLICQRTPAQSKLADCHIKLLHLSGWGNYRQDYIAIKQAKVIPVNAISSSERGGKRKRPEPITVQLYPLFLTDRQNQSRKLEEFKYAKFTTTQVMNQINQFLAGEQPTFTINLLDENSGSTRISQQSYVVFSLIQVLMLGAVGVAVILKSITG
jgi:hypothetical protein